MFNPINVASWSGSTIVGVSLKYSGHPSSLLVFPHDPIILHTDTNCNLSTSYFAERINTEVSFRQSSVVTCVITELWEQTSASGHVKAEGAVNTAGGRRRITAYLWVCWPRKSEWNTAGKASGGSFQNQRSLILCLFIDPILAHRQACRIAPSARIGCSRTISTRSLRSKRNFVFFQMQGLIFAPANTTN